MAEPEREKKSLMYRSIALIPDGQVVGSVHGNNESDVTVKLICRHDPLGPVFEVKLSVVAPTHMNLREDKYHSTSRLYESAMTSYTISPVEDLNEVPRVVRNTHKFDAVASDVSGGGKQGVVKLTLGFRPEGATHEGLFNTLLFTGYIDRETDQPLEKPWVQKAINNLRTFFSKDGEITFYIRDEEVSFCSTFEQLWAALEKELDEGPVIHRFYPASATSKDGIPRTPYLQVGQLVPLYERPSITTYKAFIHPTITDFTTRKGFAAVQSMEFEKDEVQKFNEAPARMKFLSLLGGGNQKYTGIIDINPDVDKRLAEGDIVWASFSLKDKDMITTADWRCQVTAPLPWLRSGEVACIASRPRRPPEGATEEEKKMVRDFILGRLPCGDGTKDTEDDLRTELDGTRAISVCLRLETSDQTYRRQLYAMQLLQRGKKLSDTPQAGTKAQWIDRPILRDWQQRWLNKNSIPETYTDVLGGGDRFLTHLTAQDHLDVIQYMKKVPTSHNIALGIIRGRAGVGKTFMVGALITAILQDKPDTKILVVTPSNDPSNVAARKVWEQAKEIAAIAGFIYLRGHNANVERNYTVAYAKLEVLQAKRAADKLKTPEELAAEETRKHLIAQKKARDAAKAAADREAALDKMKTRPPAPPGHQGGLIGPNGTPPVSNDGEGSDIDLPAIIHEFNEEVVVSEGCFKDDGSIDTERLERDLTLGKAAAGFRMAQHMSKYMAPGDNLVRDPRFQEVKQSLGWIVLVVAGGLVSETNRYTDEKKWTDFRVLFKTFMQQGDNMDSDERTDLDQLMKELREFCVSKASVLFSTENNMATGIYVQHFKPIITFGDEMNRSVIQDLNIVTTHFECQTLILVGDTRQLEPVVVGPTPLTGFLRESEVSAMSYFQDSHWPATEIKIQRRSRDGIMDIPTKRYYHDDVIQDANAFSDVVHPYTTPVMNLIDELIPDAEAERSAATYIEINSTPAIVDAITKSRYNLQFAAFTTNLLERFVVAGIHPSAMGVVTPYMAQVTVYQYARHLLHLAKPTLGYNQLLIGTSDSMEGEERPVVFVDTVVTHETGFVNNPGRMLVNLTRAKDAVLVIGNTHSLYQKRRDNELIELFNMAKADTRRICRGITRGHDLLTHPFVQARTKMNRANRSAIAEAAAMAKSREAGPDAHDGWTNMAGGDGGDQTWCGGDQTWGGGDQTWR